MAYSAIEKINRTSGTCPGGHQIFKKENKKRENQFAYSCGLLE
jgi:hypothetical protein